MRVGGYRARLDAAIPTIGGLAWVALLILSNAGVAPLGVIEQLFLLAPLVIVPLGLSLLDDPMSHDWPAILRHAAQFIQPLAAGLVVASFLVPRGRVAASLGIGWLLVTILVGLAGLLDLFRVGLRRAEALCFVAGQLYLLVGGVGLVSSRLGATPLGFVEPLILLFAVHYHYTGFVAPLVTGAAGQALDRASMARRFTFPAVAAGVLAGPAVIAVGFVVRAAGFGVSRWIIVLGVFVLAATLLGLVGLLIMAMTSARGRAVQVLMGASAASLAVSMVLACIYSAGEFAGNLILDVHQMAWLHGVLNAFGFSLCGLIGLHPRLRSLELSPHVSDPPAATPWRNYLIPWGLGSLNVIICVLFLTLSPFTAWFFGLLDNWFTWWGFPNLVALWILSCWCTVRVLRGIDPVSPGKPFAVGAPLLRASLWGGVAGILFLLAVVVFSGLRETDAVGIGVGQTIVVLVLWIIPFPLAFMFGSGIGVLCVALDVALLTFLRRARAWGAGTA